MILIDTPRWPAHGTQFAHLVSDASLAELIAFAGRAALHPRAFDHDHYDVAERRVDHLVRLGAQPVASTELMRRLRASGLRVRTPERTPTRDLAIAMLRQAWTQLLPGHPALGADLVARWSAEHRHYHDVRHLAQTLTALAALGSAAAQSRPVALAAWFHDAVYDGRPGDDEAASADLAGRQLTGVVPGDEVAEVVRLIELTASHDPRTDDERGRALCDADLSILGQTPGRYFVYARDVRLDYSPVSNADFRMGRLAVLDTLLGRDTLYHTDQGRHRWAEAAQRNLRAERELVKSVGPFALPDPAPAPPQEPLSERPTW